MLTVTAIELWIKRNPQERKIDMKRSITKRLSLRAKFKSTKEVEVVIMDDANNIQIEIIPIKLSDTTKSDDGEEGKE